MRNKNKLNSSAMHRALCSTCSLKFPPFSFPLPPNQLCIVRCNLANVAIFLNLSLIVDCSDICILLHSQSAVYHYHAPSFSLPPSILSLFISCLCPPPVCALPLPQKICLFDQLLHNPPTSLPHLVLVDDCHINVLQLLLPLSLSWFIDMSFVYSR